MNVTGLGWCGTHTEQDEQLAHFYAHVLGLRPVHAEPGLRVYELPDGHHVEIFGPHYRGSEHFDSGPDAGFAVRDLPAAVEELRKAGITLLSEPGPTWQHFRGLTVTSTNWSPVEARSTPGQRNDRKSAHCHSGSGQWSADGDQRTGD